MPVNLFKPIMLVHIYRHAKAGLGDQAIADNISVGLTTLRRWRTSRKDVAQTFALAEEQAPDKDSFQRYFYEALDPKLQKLWDQLMNCEYLGGGIKQINQILADHGTQARQSLFLHALVTGRYSPTRAMQRVGIHARDLDNWISTDPDFAQMVEDVQRRKGDFFEESLLKLVEQEDSAAILFANKTFNRKRGYGLSSQVQVEHSGEIMHTNSLDLSELDLKPETISDILEAVRRRDENKMRPQRPLEERLLEQITSDITDKAQAI